jgi:hypothetical protein
VTCPKCCSVRVVRFLAQNTRRVENRWRCLACWWSSADWQAGIIRPVTYRLERDADGMPVRFYPETRKA